MLPGQLAAQSTPHVLGKHKAEKRAPAHPSVHRRHKYKRQKRDTQQQLRQDTAHQLAQTCGPWPLLQ